MSAFALHTHNGNKIMVSVISMKQLPDHLTLRQESGGTRVFMLNKKDNEYHEVDSLEATLAQRTEPAA